MKLFHFHKWEPRDVNKVQVSKYWTTPEEDGGPYETERYTRVLYVCSCCGDSKVKKLSGLWDLDGLTGNG